MTLDLARRGFEGPAVDPDLATFARRPWPWNEGASFWYTRFAFLRGVGFIYLVAFGSLAMQMRGLFESHGLVPSAAFLDRVRGAVGAEAFVRLPTLFWLGCPDWAMRAGCWTGIALSLVVLGGFANAPVLAVLWVLYLSFVHIGQVFYGYGWELLLLETGFLAVFFAPPWDGRPLSRSPPPVILVWLLRWLLFRLMFGAGLIKLRGDPCWVELTCLADHYETQPNPSPLSWYLHAMPFWVHRGGVLFNHFVELVVPWGLFGPRRIRHAAGGFVILFQAFLILSGNLSFLNWLTIVVAAGGLDDSFFERLYSRRFRERFRTATEGAVESVARRRTIVGVVIVILVLSIEPAVNLMSPGQAMNASFFPLPLVNTYGAFGSVEHERKEVVLEGTRGDVLSGEVRWLEYEFPCKPGDPRRRPCLVTPYHYRLDWQMWFAGLGNVRREPWILKLGYELLRGNADVTSLLARNPFAGNPPRYVRAVLYRYAFTRDHREGWWHREPIGEYFRPMALDDPELTAFLERYGWLDGAPGR